MMFYVLRAFLVSFCWSVLPESLRSFLYWEEMSPTGGGMSLSPVWSCVQQIHEHDTPTKTLREALIQEKREKVWGKFPNGGRYMTVVNFSLTSIFRLLLKQEMHTVRNARSRPKRLGPNQFCTLLPTSTCGEQVSRCRTIHSWPNLQHMVVGWGRVHTQTVRKIICIGQIQSKLYFTSSFVQAHSVSMADILAGEITEIVFSLVCYRIKAAGSTRDECQTKGS